MPLEAEWDPVLRKVVYRDSNAATSVPTKTGSISPCTIENDNPNLDTKEDCDKSSTELSSSNHRRRSRSKVRQPKPSPTFNYDGGISSDWRNDMEPTEPRRRSTGIAPDQFHNSNINNRIHESSRQSQEAENTFTHATKPGQEMMDEFRFVTQQREIEQQTTARRKEQAYKLHAFKQITSYRSFPLQDRAIQYCKQLQEEWGFSQGHLSNHEDNTDCGNVDADVSSNATSSSSSITVSSLDPEPKRCLRSMNMSPTQCQWTRQYRDEFFRQRNVLPKQIAAIQKDHQVFGAALYCLEPRIFAVESKKSTTASSKLSPTPATIAQSADGGRRRYVVAHVGRFMDMYWCKTEPAWRHAYELIPPNIPCRLYLDIECTEHPTLVGLSTETRALQTSIMDDLFDELALELQNQYGSDIMNCPNTNYSYQLQPLQRHHVVDLDSSTETKFSRHWIVHVPVATLLSTDSNTRERSFTEALFPDSASVGTFVRQWVGRMAEQHATGHLLRNNRNSLHDYLFIPKKSKTMHNQSSKPMADQTACLIDLGVYTRNRLFRLLGSSKFGKPVTATFRIADTNQFPFPDNFGNHCCYIPEMQMPPQQNQQLTRHDYPCIEDVESTVQKSLSKTDWMPHSEALAQTFVVPLNVAKIDFPMLPRLIVPDQLDGPMRSLHRTSSRVYGLNSNVSIGKSPYPMVDDYVQMHLATRGGGTQGIIRTWSIEINPTTQTPSVISYQMSRNRWCECVGREHKSNNIIWNCDMVMLYCYQTCHDPDCRGLNFRGHPIPLPLPVQEELRDVLFEEDLARLDISEGLFPQDVKVSRQQEREPINQNAHNEFTTDIVIPSKVDDDGDDGSFENALAALNLVDLMSTSRVPTITIIKPINSTDKAIDNLNPRSVLLSSCHDNDGQENATQSTNKDTAQNESPIKDVVVSKGTNVSFTSSSDDESDTDLIEYTRRLLEKRKQEGQKG
jgi:Herpesviridae UL52/UL70 DNA primase